MSNFWISELGPLSGDSSDAFAKTFRQVPDNTMALAKIKSMKNEAFGDSKYLNVSWMLTDGEFKGQTIFQKLHVFDADPKRRHKALNMLMLMYKLFDLKPASNDAPTDQELKAFENKFAGIRVQETAPNEKGKVYNWVSEVHPAQGFVCETGHTTVVTHTVNSALSRNSNSRVDGGMPGIDDDIPF